jgi:hypothetical protein
MSEILIFGIAKVAEFETKTIDHCGRIFMLTELPVYLDQS